MGFFSRSAKLLKPLVDFPRWMDLPRIAETGSMIGKLAKDLFIPQKAKRVETFEQAITRLNVSQADLNQRQKEFKRLFLLFLFLFLVIFIYMIYLLINSYIRAGFVCMSVLLIVLAQVFRYHFWFFQIKEKKLGCSLREWFWHGLLGRKA